MSSGARIARAGSVIGFLLFWGCASAPPVRDPYSMLSPSVHSIFEEARALERDGQMDEAIIRYRATIALAPRYIEGHRQYQDAMITAGRKDEVREEYRERMRIRGTPLEWCLLGRVESTSVLQEFRFRRSIEMDPDFAWGHFALACLLAEKGQTGLALKHQVEVMQRLPDFLEGRRFLADLYRKEGYWDRAIDEFRAYRRRRPGDPYVQECLAGCLVRIGKLRKATALYKGLLAKDPSNPRAHLGLAAIALIHEDGERARDHLRESEKLGPENPDVYYNLGLLHEEILGDPEGAISFYERYLEMGGDKEFRVRLRIGRLERRGTRG